MLSSLLSDYVNEVKVAQMLTEADIDKNGTIEFEEFVEVMRKQREQDAAGGGLWDYLKIYDKLGGQEVVE